VSLHPLPRVAAPDCPVLCDLVLDRPRIMGILNRTPDSFSDGGRLTDPAAAIAAARAMALNT
jgi:dihydropteroate synthase